MASSFSSSAAAETSYLGPNWMRSAQGVINIFTGHNGGVIRYQTGNLPTGVVVNASALSLEEASITQTLNARDRQALAGFLTTIDDDTEPFTSDDDRFLDSLK